MTEFYRISCGSFPGRAYRILCFTHSASFLRNAPPDGFVCSPLDEDVAARVYCNECREPGSVRGASATTTIRDLDTARLFAERAYRGAVRSLLPGARNYFIAAGLDVHALPRDNGDITFCGKALDELPPASSVPRVADIPTCLWCLEALHASLVKAATR